MTRGEARRGGGGGGGEARRGEAPRRARARRARARGGAAAPARGGDKWYVSKAACKLSVFFVVNQVFECLIDDLLSIWSIQKLGKLLNWSDRQKVINQTFKNMIYCQNIFQKCDLLVNKVLQVCLRCVFDTDDSM